MPYDNSSRLLAVNYYLTITLKHSILDVTAALDPPLILCAQGGELCVHNERKEINCMAINQELRLISSFMNVGGRYISVFQREITEVQLCDIGRKLRRSGTRCDGRM